jgi:RNA polymerase sigma factor (TIGR02999 family)
MITRSPYINDPTGLDDIHSEAASLLGDDSLRADDRAARLLPLIYRQLRALAQAQLSLEAPDHTLQATALVHEAYIRLSGPRTLAWQSPAHFYAAVAQTMRRILVDYARAKKRHKRGGTFVRLPASVLDMVRDRDPEQIIQVDDAMRRLEDQDAELGQIVRLRVFAGLSLDQTAEVLAIPKRTLDRRWLFAKAWLRIELGRMQE